jgi:hypothetical protein
MCCCAALPPAIWIRPSSLFHAARAALCTPAKFQFGLSLVRFAFAPAAEV